jgi:hypothetical protein
MRAGITTHYPLEMQLSILDLLFTCELCLTAEGTAENSLLSNSSSRKEAIPGRLA